MNKFNLTTVNSNEFVTIFNFISRLIFCLENDSLEDHNNRRMIKPGLNERDCDIVFKWLKKHNLTEDDITHMFYINYDTENQRDILNVIFIDTDKDNLEDNPDNVVSDEGIFKDSPKYRYVFIPRNFVNYDIKKKVLNLEYIFYDILAICSPHINCRGLTLKLLCDLIANLIYDIPDLSNDKLRQHLNSLLECTSSGINYINLRTDNETIKRITDIIESYVYS